MSFFARSVISLYVQPVLLSTQAMGLFFCLDYLKETVLPMVNELSENSSKIETSSKKLGELIETLSEPLKKAKAVFEAETKLIDKLLLMSDFSKRTFQKLSKEKQAPQLRGVEPITTRKPANSLCKLLWSNP
eukprot:TRINITY_DN110316_c0_g1_i1.p2 TRINITY_DN110316_c0_g1~~TRINITY_DN110316_c0_g1_i1.p2  ORF type:complete len:132 (-),score=6.85 TRINITY_DN110316_c0_g1_i1:472-867(-)